eukprot:COSAG06_NODE_9314_length_1931_cov_1.597707_2_plen_172_part_00
MGCRCFHEKVLGGDLLEEPEPVAGSARRLLRLLPRNDGGVRAAAAEAVHLQLNQDSRTLAVISRKFAPSQHPASATATFLDLRTGAPVGEVIRCKPVVIAPNAVTDLGCEAAWPAGHEGTLLLRLALTVNERVVRCAFLATVFFNGLFQRQLQETKRSFIKTGSGQKHKGN